MIDAKTFWNKVAAKYAKSPIADMDSYEYTLARTRSYLKPDDTVLEVGCGTGSTAILLAPNVAHITATDLSDKMIAFGKERAKEAGIPNIEFSTEDMLATPPVNAPEYDAVLAHNVLHLIKEIDVSLSQINKRLKPGGVFISKSVCAVNGGVSFKMRMIKIMLPVMQWMGKAPFVAFRSIEDHEAKITAAGFKIVEKGNYPKSPPSRYIVAIKQ